MKNLIIIILIGLSFICNGQNKKIEFDNNIMFDYNMKIDINPDSLNYYFSEKYVDNIFIQVGDSSFKVADYIIRCYNFNADDEHKINVRPSADFHIIRTRELDLVDDENITTNLLLEYKKECFNDSILKYTDIGVVKVNGIDIIDGQVIHIGDNVEYWRDRIYTHKEPTFADFLNWIEKRKTK